MKLIYNGIKYEEYDIDENGNIYSHKKEDFLKLRMDRTTLVAAINGDDGKSKVISIKKAIRESFEETENAIDLSEFSNVVYDNEVYENYLINKNGDIYSIKNKRLLKKTCNPNGYIYYNLNNKSILAHRIVAFTFIENTDKSKDQVNHIDGDKTNNRVENLEWVTSKENINHAMKILGKNIGENNHMAKLTNAQAEEIRLKYNKKAGITYKVLAEEYDISVSVISRIIKNTTYKKSHF